jgi:predicted nucleic acid-binding protein
MLRARCRGLEITRSQADMLIAATAYQHDLVVATRNIRDFNYCDVQVFNPFNE